MKTRKSIINRKSVRVQQKRNARGASLIELAVVAAYIPLVALISVNLGVGVFAAGVNDNACKDAARAAGQRSTKEDAIDAAKAIVGRYADTSLLGKPQVLVEACDFEVFPDADDNPQPSKGPFVTISTQSVVNLPAPLIFDGTTFTSSIKLGSSYTFPILNPGRSDDNTEITVSNGPDNEANDASSGLDALAEKVEELQITAQDLRENADQEAAAAAQAKQQSDALDATANASALAAAADPSNPTKAAQAASDKANAASADGTTAALTATSLADAQAAEKAEAKLAAAEARLAEYEDRIERAYGSEPDEVNSSPQPPETGDAEAG
ncbi:MAG: hypothetical protein K2X81_12430 [Candidatus Obscuribacterales bacterium]|nr:hypothetical protein [Candidatus Obscuribacterales bacterium]